MERRLVGKRAAQERVPAQRLGVQGGEGTQDRVAQVAAHADLIASRRLWMIQPETIVGRERVSGHHPDRVIVSDLRPVLRQGSARTPGGDLGPLGQNPDDRLEQLGARFRRCEPRRARQSPGAPPAPAPTQAFPAALRQPERADAELGGGNR